MQNGWLHALRVYLLFVALANLLWEVLPLYTIATEGSPGEIVLAVLHCTAGELLIALSGLVASLLVAGHAAWPVQKFWRVTALTVSLGVLYTIFSEWLNIVVRESWAYSEYMPVIPWIEVGLSPMMQWMVIPLAGLLFARHRAIENTLPLQITSTS